MPSIPVIRRARAFARHHGRAERMLRGAARAEGRAFVRFDLSLQNQAAETLGGFVNMMVGQAEFFFGVERGVGVVQAEAALRNFADAAPLARHDLENLADKLLRRLVAFAAHGAGVLIFNLGRPDSNCCTTISTP